ncbi:Transmembrane domain-containing protein [Spironucleus salmonicida]|uniref:Transmembrane domain-containing protein n=1 Tax=Spironucleus salmonicida TaxID=348837 RepID=V6LM88_9EUKA|nr:Transmembrane domain-containing protein [Spironucleus salmonicida]|eukprot:EST45807.1 Transmembrane domain-containing protein [Spironucleus salmonicida]
MKDYNLRWFDYQHLLIVMNYLVITYNIRKIGQLSTKISLLFLLSVGIENPLFLFVAEKRPFRAFSDYSLKLNIAMLLLIYSQLIELLQPFYQIIASLIAINNIFNTYNWFSKNTNQKLKRIFIMSQCYRRVVLVCFGTHNFGYIEILRSFAVCLLQKSSGPVKTKIAIFTICEVIFMVYRDAVGLQQI